MSVVKNVETVSLNIEVQNGTDKAGDPIYAKKSFSDVRVGVDADSAYAVAEAIKIVLEGDTRSSFLTEVSNLTDNTI